ncbi:MAG: glycosyltransferase [Cyclobacteriaceae bacterium]|nr:glycosyltransferase [Cyclobacteriaceae bacterium]
MDKPLVSVICLCYNQAPYVEDAIISVLNQTWENIELIVVDDASTDNSQQVIEKVVRKNPGITFLPNKTNKGNCASFNHGFLHAKGEYIVDLAADDLLLPDRLEKQLHRFAGLSSDYGVVYTDAIIVDENDREIRRHEADLKARRMVSHMPEGNVFEMVLKRYFIPAPTMLIRKKVLDELGGYDASLAYEDFDFWVRSARNWNYAYINEPLTKIRKLPGSMSASMYGPDDPKVLSTFIVCEKAMGLIKGPAEKTALIARVRYELRQALWHRNKIMARKWYGMLRALKGSNLFYRLLAVFTA